MLVSRRYLSQGHVAPEPPEQRPYLQVVVAGVLVVHGLLRCAAAVLMPGEHSRQ